MDRKTVGVALVALVCTLSFANTKLLRFPAIHGNQILFTYAGDLWLASAEGGNASRLTSDEGLEFFAEFSPDGSQIAFTGQYDGDEQVYVMPTTGGAPQQLTFYPARGPLPDRWGYDNQVYGWSVDGQSVLFRSLRDSWDLSDSKLFTVSTGGGMPVALPMPVAGAGDFSSDGKKVVYSPLVRDFRTWKRYQGGWAQELLVFDLQTHDARRIATSKRADRDPMWMGDAVYFNSDRDGHFNLYRYDFATDGVTQLTHSTEWDVRWPSSDKDHQIIYELGGVLHVLDVTTLESRKLDIQVGDDGIASRPEMISVANQIEEFDLSPNAKRALFVARGDIFTAPVEQGVTRNLTQSSDAHEREVAWSPDGQWIAYVSDQTGEEHLYVMAHDGGSIRQISKDIKTRLYSPRWSPDSKLIALTEKGGKIWVIDVASGQMTEVADEIYNYRTDYAWSPDAQFLTFSLNEPNQLSSIYIWSAASKKTTKVTDSYFDEYSPRWDPKGELLYYLSRRGFEPQIGSFEWNYVVDRETGIYALALHADVKNPYTPRNDDELKADEAKHPEEPSKPAKKGKTKNEKDEKKPETPKVKIDFDGLAERVIRIPVETDNYVAISPIEGGLLYGRGGAFYYGRSSDVPTALFHYDIEKQESKEIASRLNGWALSRDGQSILASSSGAYSLYTLNNGDKPKPVSTSNLRAWRVPKEEWATIFDEVWRRFRDHFYVENMHGYDWDAIGNQYRALLPHVSHRSDLNYILGEMAAELNVSHAYVSGGDTGAPARPNSALLGAELTWNEAAKHFQFGRIIAGNNQEPTYRSPLTEVGVQVASGEYLLAINGSKLGEGSNPYAILRHAGGQGLELTVSKTADGKSARKVLVAPIGDESSLRYLTWVNKNRDYVTAQTDGRVGYLHIPDMGASGIREFIKWYYGQIRKEGLIIDVRGNGGGNVSQMIINRLSRTLLGLDYARHTDLPTTYPNIVFHGSMVCLLSQTSASDGDIFPWTFRRAGLGPLIGKRSWGGIVGITNHGPLLDGGSVNVPEFGNASDSGEWVVEGHGVDPDIEVENDPLSVINGKDNQLDRGIQEVLKRMQSSPKSLPARPADPIKTPAPVE